MDVFIDTFTSLYNKVYNESNIFSFFLQFGASIVWLKHFSFKIYHVTWTAYVSDEFSFIIINLNLFENNFVIFL